MGVKVEIPGVEVQGTLKPENLFDTLAALLMGKSLKSWAGCSLTQCKAA